MGLYDRINFFDDATSIDDDNIARQLAALPAPNPQPPSQPEEHSSLFRRIAGDTAVTALKGAIGLPESIVGIADIPTGGRVGKGLEYVGFRPREAKKTLDELYSPEQKAAFANVQQAKGFLPTVQAIVGNPSVAAHTALESAPSLLGGAGIARGAIKVLPKLAPFVAGAIGEGAITAGQNAEAIRAETPDHLLTPEQAGLAGLSGIVTGGIGAAAGKFANKAGIANIETMLASGSGKTINKGLARQMAEGALTEGMLEELPQSIQEQALQNIALGKPWHEGVVESGAQGMVTGGLMGAGGGGYNALAQHPAQTEQPGAAVQQSPEEAAQQAKAAGHGPLGAAIAAGEAAATMNATEQTDSILTPEQQQAFDRLKALEHEGSADLPDLPQAGPATTELLGGPAEGHFPVTMPQPDELALANHWADEQIKNGMTHLMNVRAYDKTGQALVSEWKRLTGQQQEEPTTLQQPELAPQPATSNPVASQMQPNLNNKPSRSVNPAQDDLITAVAKLGGISSDQYRQQVGSLDDQHLMKHGINFAVHKNGLQLDRMREQLEELGYLPPQSEIRDLLDAMQHDGNRYSVQHQANLEQDLSTAPFDVADLNPALDSAPMYSLKNTANGSTVETTGGINHERTDAGRIAGLQPGQGQAAAGGEPAGRTTIERIAGHTPEQLAEQVESAAVIKDRFTAPIRQALLDHYHNPAFWAAMAGRQPELAPDFKTIAAQLDTTAKPLNVAAKIAANLTADALRIKLDPAFELQASNHNPQAVQELAGRWYAERGEQSPFYKLWSHNAPVIALDNAVPVSALSTGKPVVVKGWHTSPGSINRYHTEFSGAHSGFETKGWIWMATHEGATDHLEGVEGIHGNQYTTEQFYQRMLNPKVLQMIGKTATRSAMERAEQNGHDGILLVSGGKLVNAVVFDPRNLKAVENRGTFNSSDYSRYSLQGGFNHQDATQPLTSNQNTATQDATPQNRPLFNLTTEIVAKAFPKQTITEDKNGFTVTMKNGATIRVNGTDEILFNQQAAEAAYGRKLQADEKPVAAFQRMGQDAVISLTEAGASEIHHETFHAAMALALNQSQRATLLKKFGNEEAAAQEYQRLRDSNSLGQRKGHLWLQAIYQFFQKVRGLFNPALQVMQDIASGEVWNGDNTAATAAPAYSIKTTLERIAASRTKPNDTIQQPKGMTAGIASTDPTIEQRWQTAHGLSDGPGLKERLQGFLQRMLSERQHFPNLDTSSFSGKRTADILRRFESSDVAAKAKTAEYLHSLTASFGPQKMDLFSRKVVLDDLINEAAKGRALPFGYTPETVKADHKRISKLVEANPDIKAAVEHRAEVSKQLVLELVDNDLLPVESVLTPEGLENYKATGKYTADDINTGYFRHQVLEHANARKWAGISTAGEVRNKQRGWQKGREGSELDINTNFLEAEFEYYSQAMKELATKKALDEVLSINDLAPALREQAKQEGAADWKALIPEGYTTWQPEKGSVFYKGQTMPESIITRFVEQNPAFAEVAEKFKEVLILGGRKEEVVIPAGLAKTLDNLRTNREDATLDTINKKLIGGWKVWTLLSPRRALKYNLNNMSGDLDIVLAADPGIMKHFSTAWINALNRKAGNPMTFEELAMLDRGVIDAGISINEIPDISKLPGFQHLKEGTRDVKLLEALKTGDLTKLAPANLIAKYFDKVSSLTQLREGLLREAAYLRAKELLDQGKPVYWASTPAEINSLTNTRDKAAKLSRELLGDYGNLSAHGEKIRTSLIPFWSWMEINAPRYYRLFKNAATQGEAGSTAARMAAVGSRKAAGAALGIGEKVLLTHLLFAAVSAFNHLLHPEEEEKLSAQVRGQLHLILGTTSDGKTLTLRFSGAFSDVLAWAGLEDYPESFKKLETGRMDAKEMLKKMALATPNKLVNAASPFTKLAGELMTGKSIYPDMTKPMPIRDRTEHIARFFALDEEYKALAGKPSKGYLNSLKNLLVYESDPGENAYHDIKQQVGRFLEKHGREQTTAEPTERSKALYYFRQAMKYRDREAVDHYKAEYLKAGGKPENLHQSIKRQHPLAGMPLHMRQQFLKSLSAQDRDNIKLAVDWYKQAYR